jgi:hypothetical protein
VTIVGYALGTTLSVAVVGATARPVSAALNGIVFVALFGAVVGIGVGAAQFVVLPRGTASVRAWILATMLGAGSGFAVASLVGEILGDLISPSTNIVLGGGAIQITSGAIVGLGVSLAQWRVVRSMLPTASWWIVATMVGTGLRYGAAAAVLELLEVPVLKANLIPAFGAIIGLLAGVSQSLVLRRSDSL